MINVNREQAGFMKINLKTTGKRELVKNFFQKSQLRLISLHNENGVISILNHWE
jgi:hypothetical protein